MIVSDLEYVGIYDQSRKEEEDIKFGGEDHTTKCKWGCLNEH